MCLSRTPIKASQSTINKWFRGEQRTIDEWAGEECKFQNIKPAGDPMIARMKNDGIHRMGYQNTRGTTLNSGLEIPEDLDVMRELGIDMQGMSEINKPWSAGNMWRYEMMTDIMFKNSKSSFSSAPAAHICKDQLGGTCQY